jgi:hypothetical protein
MYYVCNCTIFFKIKFSVFKAGEGSVAKHLQDNCKALGLFTCKEKRKEGRKGGRKEGRKEDLLQRVGKNNLTVMVKSFSAVCYYKNIPYFS